MADAHLNVAQLSDILRKLDEVVAQTESIRQVILEAMARRRRGAERRTSTAPHRSVAERTVRRRR